MIVMVSNQTGSALADIGRRHPGRLGHLYSPGGLEKAPKAQPDWVGGRYALDNGRFRLLNGEEWSERDFLSMVDLAAERGLSPRFLTVPDLPGSHERTLDEWESWAPRLSAYGWPLAFVAQDGCDPGDVPHSADVVFLGGTTEWKWRSLEPFCASFQRVHVGRVNAYRRLIRCDRLGVESVDGTGWFHDNPRQLQGLRRYLERGVEQFSMFG